MNILNNIANMASKGLSQNNKGDSISSLETNPDAPLTDLELLYNLFNPNQTNNKNSNQLWVMLQYNQIQQKKLDF
jgi:hypothetical protein